MAMAEPGSSSGSVAQADSIGLGEAVERDSARVCGAVHGVVRILKEQQELFVPSRLF